MLDKRVTIIRPIVITITFFPPNLNNSEAVGSVPDRHDFTVGLEIADCYAINNSEKMMRWLERE